MNVARFGSKSHIKARISEGGETKQVVAEEQGDEVNIVHRGGSQDRSRESE